MMTGGCESPPSHQPCVKWLSSELGSWALEDLVAGVLLARRRVEIRRLEDRMTERNICGEGE